jgi:hypothetical protein
MLERVDTRHRWLDILLAGGVVRHVFFGHFAGGRGNMASASRARRYCSESSRIVLKLSTESDVKRILGETKRLRGFRFERAQGDLGKPNPF